MRRCTNRISAGWWKTAGWWKAPAKSSSSKGAVPPLYSASAARCCANASRPACASPRRGKRTGYPLGRAVCYLSVGKIAIALLLRRAPCVICTSVNAIHRITQYRSDQRSSLLSMPQQSLLQISLCYHLAHRLRHKSAGLS